MQRKLTYEIQKFVAESIGQFATPTEIVEEVRERYGIEMTREHVRAYNPWQRSDVAEKWVVICKAARAKFDADVSPIPLAHQAYRLAELQKLYGSTKSEEFKAELLAQAAKEIGGAFTNRRELSGQGGGPIQTENASDRKVAEFIESAEKELAAYMKSHKVTRKVALQEWETKNIAPNTARRLAGAGA